jgi:hypothetical protein
MVRNEQSVDVDEEPNSVRTLLTKPSGFTPLAMSLAAISLMVGYLVVVGDHPQPDEGAAARLWQLLMAAQVPVIAYFAVRWLGPAPRPAGLVLCLQILAALAAAAPVFLLES